MYLSAMLQNTFPHIFYNARQFIADNYGIEPLTRQLLAFYDKRLNLE
jgi:hypothetical protein